MARSTVPQFSRGRVNRAGRAVRKGNATAQDHRVIENYRASHSHVLNAFQASLRNRARDKDITVAQRLKRRFTIYDKLKRHPNFSLVEMQDIAGCRLIFKNIDDLYAFRSSYLNARFRHEVITGDDKYDYIAHPKLDGYRGVHDVYEYKSRSEAGAAWNRLRIELQYRTIYQHAWATAVEVAGLLTDNEHKFGRAAAEYAEFFCLSSEMIARAFEASKSCGPNLSLSELVEQFDRIDSRVKLMNLFEQYNNIAPSVHAVDKNVILIFNKRADPEKRTDVRQFSSFSDAVKQLEIIEEANVSEGEPYDVVLVRSVSSQSQGSIESAFRNYFADTRDFTSYIEAARRLA